MLHFKVKSGTGIFMQLTLLIIKLVTKLPSFRSHLGRKELSFPAAKLYIPSTINISRKLLSKTMWADKKWAGFGQISLYIK